MFGIFNIRQKSEQNIVEFLCFAEMIRDLSNVASSKTLKNTPQMNVICISSKTHTKNN